MRWLRACLLLICLPLVWAHEARAHALDPGFLDLRQIDEQAWQVFWRKPDVQGDPMLIDARLPETCTPARGGVPRSDGSAWVSHWTAICTGGLAGQTLTIEGLELQATEVLVRVQPQEGAPLIHRLTPDAVRFTLPDQQSSLAVFQTYGVLGFNHILAGLDHLLFVFALVLLIPNRGHLIGAITAFTVAHSITLALAALGHLSIPGPPVEAIIALSIVFLAIELLKREEGAPRLSERAPWIVAFAFGLLHGLGFAGALREIGLPDADVALALLAFNLGVEAGQLAFVAVVLTAGFALRKLVEVAGEIPEKLQTAGTVTAGYAIGGIATIWLAERLSAF